MTAFIGAVLCFVALELLEVVRLLRLIESRNNPKAFTVHQVGDWPRNP